MADEDELRELEVALLRATQGKNLAALERMLGDDFVLVTGRPGAETRTRAEWLDITMGSYRIDSFEFEDVEVRLYEETAIVLTRYSQTGAMGDEPRNTTFRMTDVWRRHPQGWRLHVRHAQPIAGD